MAFVKLRKIWYTFSCLLVIASIISLIFNGLNWGIDFTGGSLMEVKFLKTNKVNPQSVKSKLKEELPEIGSFNVQAINQTQLLLRFPQVNEAQHQQILQTLKKWFTDVPPPKAVQLPMEEAIEQVRFTSIGPTIGKELRDKSLWAIWIVIVLIILYIAWAFRRINASFKYGFIAIIALVHDVLITLGVFSLLGFEISSAFIAALLTILGYSVNDTIVIFDRVRENLLKFPKEKLPVLVNKSLEQTLRRSLFTSLTTLFVLLAVYFFGGESINNFVLALIIGIISGTYSSIFLASPLLITLRKKHLKE